MDPVGLLLILLGMALNVAAQVLLKFGGQHDGVIALSDPMSVVRLALNPWLIAAVTLYGISFLNWYIVLKRMDLSLAYPMMSLGFVFTFFIGIWLFKEPWSSVRLVGVLVIIAGVILLNWPIKPPSPLVSAPSAVPAPHSEEPAP